MNYRLYKKRRINNHFICIDCRIGNKTTQETLKCPHCGKDMIIVSVTFRIPKKTDDKGWKYVKEQIMKGNRWDSIWWN